MHFKPANTFILAGPTAVGKSAIALEIAAALDAEIVNADAFQIYREFSILTAKPSAEEFSRCPHHLYDLASVSEPINAAAYAQGAEKKLAEISQRGRPALLVGGSGLYLKALTHGLSPLPPASSELRHELEALSTEELFARLQELDPESVARIAPNNARHALRALEITLLTGQPASQQRRDWEDTPPRIPGVFFTLPREQLYARIDARTAAMLEGGAVQEVAQLSSLAHTACKTIGVAEIQELLAGKIARFRCQALIAQKTRRYAKRQLTWFRHQSGLVEWPLDNWSDQAKEKLLDTIRQSFASSVS